MGEGIFKNWRVLVSTLFSVVLVVGAFVLARGIESPPIAQASAEAALLGAIAVKDSDADGLPDWEEGLYGTDPRITDTSKLGMTDGQAVARGLIVPRAIANISVATSSPSTPLIVDSSLPPAPAEGTLTAAFAKNFFTMYLSMKELKGGADLTEADMQEVASQALSTLSEAITIAPDFKSAKDLKISGSGAEALKEFAVNAEAILLKNKSSASKSELLYLQDAVQNNDATGLPHIDSIARAYRDSAVGLAVLPVPQELASANLALINALMRVSQISGDFVQVNTDPLVTILALQQYSPAVLALGTAFKDIGEVYKTAGISLAAGTPGASFVNLITDVADKQAAAKKL